MTPFQQRFPRLWQALDQISVVVIASFLFFLFSLLIITIPAALVGLFAAIGSLIRPVQGETIGRFWRGFRRSFGTALLLGLVSLLFGIIVYVDIRFFWAMESTLGKLGALFFGSVATVGLMTSLIAWPLLAWFPQPLGKLLKRAFALAAVHPLVALAGLAGVALLPVLFVLLPSPLNGLIFFAGPGLAALIAGLAAWRVMRPYAGLEDEFAE